MLHSLCTSVCVLHNCVLQSGASGTKDDAQRKFEKQKAEVVGESKENIKEAESTLQAKASALRNLFAMSHQPWVI